MTRIETRTYETRSGELADSRVLLIPAVVKSINRNVRLNANGTEWRLCSAEIAYPNGTTKIVPAQLFEKSLDMHPDSFMAGEQIELEVQTEGESAGMAKMQLPSMERIDVTAFMVDTQSIIENNVVGKEVVI